MSISRTLGKNIIIFSNLTKFPAIGVRLFNNCFMD